MKCKSCLFEGEAEIFQVKEMQLGTREVFSYGKCSNCGSIQLLDMPADIGQYYPPDKYYSYNTGDKKQAKKDSLRKIKAGYILYGQHKIAGSLLSIGYKVPEYFNWLKEAKVQFTDAILDAGCGNGALLLSLYANGFTDLTGADPFIPVDYDYGGVKIYKKEIFHLDRQFDFIMLNHVFEHVDNPLEILQQLYKLLKPKKYVLIRTPVMGTYAWETYKENWIGLDAPRHLIIHTVKSMQLLAEKAGFTMASILFDSTANNLIISEQYKRDIPLPDADSYIVNKNSTQFTKEEIEQFAKTAQQTNREQQGDQAAFFLYKS